MSGLQQQPPQNGERTGRFEALEVSLAAIRALRVPVQRIGDRKPRLADELFRAATSAALNLGEGRRRAGRDRKHHWRVASGSAYEALVSLRVAEAWGLLEESEFSEAYELLDRVSAMLWRMTR